MRPSNGPRRTRWVSDVRFLQGYHEGALDPTRELQRDIVRVLRQVRPRRVLM